MCECETQVYKDPGCLLSLRRMAVLNAVKEDFKAGDTTTDTFAGGKFTYYKLDDRPCGHSNEAR
jgi:hypothetical protein